MSRKSRRPSLVAAPLLLMALANGCATYTDRLNSASLAAAGGNYEGAVSSMNHVLGVGSSDELPDKWSGDRALGTLERGSLQQALGRYKGSAHDFSAAEQELELLDLKGDPLGKLASYIYSDSAKVYRTPPTERLALNAVNLLNYLADGDLDGAAVEARRFQVMRDFLASKDIEADGPATLGTYLAGFTFERRGEGDRALRYYEEALARGPLESLGAPIARLSVFNPYRGPHLSEVLASRGGADTAAPEAELLIVLSLGRVPHKVPKRIPVGAAIGLAGALITDDLDVLKYSATKVLVYPELVATPSSLGPVVAAVDGRTVAVEEITSLGAAIREEYEEAKPKIIAAALTRVAARAAVAEGVRQAGKQESQALGDVLSILTESVLVALDRPDTRSWTMLADRVLATRLRVSPGTHEVAVSFAGAPGADRHMTIDIPRGGFAVVVVTEPR